MFEIIHFPTKIHIKLWLFYYEIRTMIRNPLWYEALIAYNMLKFNVIDTRQWPHVLAILIKITIFLNLNHSQRNNF